MPVVALVGCAHIHTPGFVKKLKERAGVTVKVVWDPDAARSSKRAEELGTQSTPDVASVWSDPAIEAVVICSETNRHAELVTAAANAKKHMFVEKPLGYAAADAVTMAGLIESAGVIFQTGYFMRSGPINQFLKQHVEAGSFGQITRIRHSNCHQGSLGGWFDTEWRWMADPVIAGCGAFGDLGTHSLDILMWLMGGVQSVAGDIQVVTRRYGGCDESGEALLHFRNGAIGTLAAGWVDVANPVTCQISGTTGAAWVVNGKLFVQSKDIAGADGKEPWTALPEALPHAFDLFLDALEGKKVPLVTPREAAARSMVMEAIYKAAAARTWVNV